MINFDLIEEIKLDNFKGGDGSVIAKIFTDNNNKIMKATLKKGASIGMHTHDTSSEIIFVINGTASCDIDGKKEQYNRRAHSSVVEHRTAVPVVIGSNPIVPFFFNIGKKEKRHT